MFGKFSLFKKSSAGGVDPSGDHEIFKYCPRCKDEYRAEIVKCAVCNVELVSAQKAQTDSVGGSSAARVMVAISSGDELATIRRGRLADIKELQRFLKKERIDSLIAGEEAGCAKGCCNSTPFDLQVRQKDYGAAQQALEEEFRRTTGLGQDDLSRPAVVFTDERSGAVNCPACDCTFVPEGDPVCPECGLCF